MRNIWCMTLSPILQRRWGRRCRRRSCRESSVKLFRTKTWSKVAWDGRRGPGWERVLLGRRCSDQGGRERSVDRPRRGRLAGRAVTTTFDWFELIASFVSRSAAVCDVYECRGVNLHCVRQTYPIYRRPSCPSSLHISWPSPSLGPSSQPRYLTSMHWKWNHILQYVLRPICGLRLPILKFSFKSAMCDSVGFIRPCHRTGDSDLGGLCPGGLCPVICCYVHIKLESCPVIDLYHSWHDESLGRLWLKCLQNYCMPLND